MEFNPTPDQRAIREMARDFLAATLPIAEVRRLALDEPSASRDRPWREIAELGWLGVLVDERRGGLGLGPAELCILCDELGYAAAPVPYLSTALAAAWLIADNRTDDHTAARLLDGSMRAVLVARPAEGTLDGAGERFSGTFAGVDGGVDADLLVVDTGDSVFACSAADAGVSVTPEESMDHTRQSSRVTLDDARAHRLDMPADTAAILRSCLPLGVAADSTGVARRALEFAVAYANDRQQFGRPIATFQGVSHRCAQMKLEVEGATVLVIAAAQALHDRPQESQLEVSMAKHYASDVGWRVPASAIQVHGAIGYTWEHDLHLFLKRGRVNAHIGGDARRHRAVVAAAVAEAM